MPNTKKQSQLQTLTEEIEKNANFAIVKFEKTTHITLEKLRRELAANNAHIKVIKNTLFEKAIQRLANKNKNLKEVGEKALPVKDNSALLQLGEDWNKGLSAFHQFSKKEDSLSFKFGFLDNKLYLQDDMKRIAQLPSKEVLVGKLLGSLQSPLYSFNYALKYHMQKFVYILSEKSKQN